MVSSSSDIYQKTKFMREVDEATSKQFLEELTAKTMYKSGLVFRTEGLLMAALLEKDQDSRQRLARKEIAALAGSVRGITSEDVHSGLLQAVKALLPG